MRRHSAMCWVTLGIAAGLSVATAGSQTAPDTVEAHVAAAKAAAGQHHTGLFNAVCAAATQPPAAPQRGQAAGRGQQPPPDSAAVVRGAGEGLRQSLLRRARRNGRHGP